MPLEFFGYLSGILCVVVLEKTLEIHRFFVPQIKETMPWMMGMKAHFGTSRAFAAFDTHLERPFTADAKFKLTLGARKMHAPTFS